MKLLWKEQGYKYIAEKGDILYEIVQISSDKYNLRIKGHIDQINYHENNIPKLVEIAEQHSKIM